MIHVYVAGPMSNISQFNFPLFYSAAAELRSQGFQVTSPAELDDAEDKGAALKSPDGDPNNRAIVQKTWGDFLSRDVKLLADGGIKGIVFLPGWENSRGARLEAYVGLTSGFKFFLYDPETRKATDISARGVFYKIGKALGHIV